MAARKHPQANNPNVIDKERQVVELKRAGATYDDCARIVGYATPQGAYLAFQRALKRTLVAAGTEELREIELDRLDRLQRGVWAAAASGDVQAINTVLRIMDRRARYLGLDAPLVAHLTVEQVDNSSVDAEVQRLVALLAPPHAKPSA